MNELVRCGVVSTRIWGETQQSSRMRQIMSHTPDVPLLPPSIFLSFQRMMYITITVVPPFRKRSAAAQLKKWSIPKPLASFPFTCFVLHSSHVLVPTPFILFIHDFKTGCHFGWSTFYRLPLSWAYINPVDAGLWASADWWHQRGVSSRSSSDLWFLLVDSDPDHVPSPFSRVHGLTAKQEMETRLMGEGNKAMIQEPRVKSLRRKDG